jgi:multidrug efflux system membrane fusion protein
LLIGGVVVLVGLAWYFHGSGESAGTGAPAPAAKSKGGGRRSDGGPLSVAGFPVKRGDIKVYLSGLGTVVPFENVTIRTQISGKLMEVNFKEGQMVKAGDLIALVDPRPYQVAQEQARGQLKQAQAALKEAQIDYDRYVALSKQDSIAQQQVDQQSALVTQDEGAVQTSQAALDNATLNLEYCHITATATGQMGLRQVDPGNYVTPGDANGLVTMEQIKPISVIFTLPEDNVQQVLQRIHVKAALPVDVYDRSDSSKLASGVLMTPDNQVDATTGTFKLRAQFANEDDRLFPNQFVNTRMLVDVMKNTLVIPTTGVERGQQGTFVYVVTQDNVAKARPVTLGPVEGDQVAVISGVKEGEMVVTEGADRLRDGMAVAIQAGAPGDSGAPGGAPKKGKKKKNETPAQ